MSSSTLDAVIPVVAAARGEYAMWPPEHCPLCAAGDTVVANSA